MHRPSDKTLDIPVRFDEKLIENAAHELQWLEKCLPPVALTELDRRIRETMPVDPRHAITEEAWQVIWNKPLFANARVDAARGWYEQLSRHMPGMWHVMGTEACQITPMDGQGRKRDHFRIEGARGLALKALTTTADYRLFAIQNAAMALRRRAHDAIYPVADFDRPLDELLPDLEREFGWGWGRVTLLHMLTDFGVATKTDRHVVRTLRHLGIWNGSRDEVSLPEALSLNRAVRAIGNVFEPLTPQRFRRLDLVLMMVSEYQCLYPERESRASETPGCFS